MANTYNFDGHVLNIVALDSDWLCPTHFKGSQRIHSILFFAAAAAEHCIVRRGSITGPVVFNTGVVAGAGISQVLFDGEKFELALDFSEGVYVNAASMVVVILKKSS